MAYLDLSFNGQSLGRRDLDASIVVGRAPECDVAVRDILLSRLHCKLELTHGGWIVSDLGSKNGTSVNGEKLVGSRPLAHGDVVRLGRTKILFHEGRAVADDERALRPFERASDPVEALSGTLSGFTFLERGEQEPFAEHLPEPRPHPREPAAYAREDVQDLVAALASSSWDSIYATVRQPSAAQAIASVHQPMPRAPRMRPRSPIDLSLQVVAPGEDGAAAGDSVSESEGETPTRNAGDGRPARGRVRRRRPVFTRARTLRWTAAAVWVVAGGVAAWHWSVATSSPSAVSAETLRPRVQPVAPEWVPVPQGHPAPSASVSETTTAAAVAPETPKPNVEAATDASPSCRPGLLGLPTAAVRHAEVPLPRRVEAARLVLDASLVALPWTW